jgi:hypothetical protein
MAISGRGGIAQALMEQQGLSPARDINEFAYTPNFNDVFGQFNNQPAIESPTTPQDPTGQFGNYNFVDPQTGQLQPQSPDRGSRPSMDNPVVAPPVSSQIDPGILAPVPAMPGDVALPPEPAPPNFDDLFDQFQGNPPPAQTSPEERAAQVYDPYGLGKDFLQAAYKAAGVPLSRGFVGNVPGHQNFGGGFDGGGGGGGGGVGGGGGATGGGGVGGGAAGGGGIGGGATGGGIGGGAQGGGFGGADFGGMSAAEGMSAAAADAAAAAQAAADAESYGTTMGGDEEGAGPEGGTDDEGDSAGEV